MKTTVEIPDLLFRRAKKYCADRGIAFRQLVETGLHAALDLGQAKPGPRFRLKPFGYGGRGQQEQDWNEIRELIYQGRGGTSDPHGGR